MANDNNPLSATSVIPGTNPLFGDQKRNNLKGSDSNDYLDGAGGSDILRGRRGDDTLVFDAFDRMIDGGQGNDTLRVSAGDQTFWLNKKQRIKGIEAIDFTSTGNRLTLTAADIKRVSDTDQLMITGGEGNIVDAGSGWQWTGISNDQKFNIFTKDGIRLSVDARIQMVGFTPPPPAKPAESADTSSGWSLNLRPPVNYAPVVNGSDGDEELTSQSPMAVIFGGNGDDTLSSSSYGATLDGGSGDDTIVYDDSHQLHEGGVGLDTLRVSDNDEVISLSDPDLIKGIEWIDITGTGNTITLTSEDIQRISDINTLTISGDYTNRIDIDSGWQQSGTSEDGAFTVFVKDDIRLFIRNGMQVEGFPYTYPVYLRNGGDRWEGPLTRRAGEIDYIVGGDGDDVIISYTQTSEHFGGLGNDTLSAAGLQAKMFGQDGNDTLTGTGIDATLDGGTGNDLLYATGIGAMLLGGSGNDLLSATGAGTTLNGGDGDDTLLYRISGQRFDGGAGNDTLLFMTENQAITLANQLSVEGIDVIALGSSGTQLTLTSDDVRRISDNNMLTITGDQNNQIALGEGWRWIGLTADNEFNQFTKDDVVVKIDVDMSMDITDGINFIQLSSQADTWTGSVNNPLGLTDYVLGNVGNDSLISLTAGAELFGEAGDDTLSSTGDDSVLDGGDDNDTLIFTNNTQILRGGSGSDVLRLSKGGQNVSLSVPDVFNSIEAVEFASSNNTLTLTASDILQISDTNTLVISGVSKDNTVIAGNNWQWAGFNEDASFHVFIQGNARLMTQIGTQIEGINMWKISEAGNGDFSFSTAPETPAGIADYVDGGDGNDTLSSSTPFALIYGRNGNDTLSSTAKGAMLDGGAGDDRLVLNNASQLLQGGTGNDTLYLAETMQTISLDDHAHIRDVEIIQFGAPGQILQLSSDDIARLSGGELVIISGNASHTLALTDVWSVGEFSSDARFWKLTKDGQSILVPTSVNITAMDKRITKVLGPENDNWTGLPFIPLGFTEFIFGGDGNDTLASSTPSSRVYGGTGDDALKTSGKGSQLFGDAGNDTLEAAADATMYGGDGNDQILFNSRNFLVGYGGAGADTFRSGQSAANGIDILIADFSLNDKDKIHIDILTSATFGDTGFLKNYGIQNGSYLYEIGYNHLSRDIPLIRLTGSELAGNLIRDDLLGAVSFGNP